MVEITAEKTEMRQAFCEELLSLARNDDKVVLLDADLMGAMGTKPFLKEFPERTVDCGIQEANMVGVACGLSAVGKIPFAHTFAPFITRRVCDQVFISGAYARQNVKLIGSDPGITAQANGGTHMPFEDMGIMMNIPEMTIIEPADIYSMEQILRQMYGTYGMQYMRLVRKKCQKIYQGDEPIEIGKAALLREGQDLTLIASGFCVAEALLAADRLAEAGVSARVLDMHTWKPIDAEAIYLAATETGAIVTCENHNVLTGLGATVAGITAEMAPVPMEMIGIKDRFGQVGDLDFLAEEYGLTAAHIVSAAVKVMKRKGETK